VTCANSPVTLILYYYQYSEVTLAVGFAPQSTPRIDCAALRQELQLHAVLQPVFNAAAAQLDTLLDTPSGPTDMSRVPGMDAKLFCGHCATDLLRRLARLSSRDCGALEPGGAFPVRIRATM